MTYIARYAHGNDGVSGELVLSALSDKRAVKELRQFVVDSYRNSTWASVELKNGSTYVVFNRHGRAVGAYA